MYEMSDVEILKDDGEEEVIYPCIILRGIVTFNQFNQFIIPEDLDTEVNKCRLYGEKNNIPKFIGFFLLTSEAILKLNYMSIQVVYYEDKNNFTYFDKDEDIMRVCTFKGLIKHAYSLCDNNVFDRSSNLKSKR